MAKKGTADLKNEGEELKALLAKVKKKPHNCAMLMAKEGIVFEVHLKKSPEVLVKAAKKAGGMAKGVWGTVSMDGQVVIIDPVNEKIPGNLPKIAKKYFSERGLKNRLEINMPEEEAAPAAPDAAPADTDSANQSPDADGNTDKDPRVALLAGLKALKPRIDTLRADKKSLMIDALNDMLGLFTRAMEDELFDRAEDALGKVGTVLDDYDGLMAQKKPFLDRMAALKRGYERVAKDGTENADTIARYKREFDYALENNEWFSAGEKLDQIETLIDQSGSSGEPPETGANPSAAPGPEPAPQGSNAAPRDHLTAAFKALTPNIKTALQSDDKTLAKNVATLAKGFATALKGEDMAKTQKILDALRQMVARKKESPDQDHTGETGAPSGRTPSDQSETQAQTPDIKSKEGRLSKLAAMKTTLESMLKTLELAV